MGNVSTFETVSMPRRESLDMRKEMESNFIDSEVTVSLLYSYSSRKTILFVFFKRKPGFKRSRRVQFALRKV